MRIRKSKREIIAREGVSTFGGFVSNRIKDIISVRVDKGVTIITIHDKSTSNEHTN